MKRILLLMVLLLALAGPVLADGPYQPGWTVMAGGGGSMSDGVYALGGTAGQGAVGVAEDGAYTLQAGFWHTWAAFAPSGGQYAIYLPLVLRNR